MRYLIFADLHANIFSLMAILKEAERLDIDKIISLGDLIGYNSYPNECLDLIREKDIPSIKGNHEALVSGTLTMDSCKSERSQNAIEITRNILTKENERFISDLPQSVPITRISTGQHASHSSIYKSINTVQRARPEFIYMKTVSLGSVFFGHTHRPGVFKADTKLENIVNDTTLVPFNLSDEFLYMINPGSAGEPRHGLPTSFIVYDESMARVEYKIISLPLAERKELKQNNRRLFGITSIYRLPKQIKEKSKRVYYNIGRLKDTISGRESE